MTSLLPALSTPGTVDFPSDASGLISQDALTAMAGLSDLAGQTIPGCDGAGITLTGVEGPIYRSSNDFARALDEIQYGSGEGPCVEAVAQERTVVSGAIGVGETRWPSFTAAAGELEVRSVLSVPLAVEGQVVGSVNLYSRRRDAFEERAVTAAEAFARPTAFSLQAAAEQAGHHQSAPGGAGLDAPSSVDLPADLVHGLESVIFVPGDAWTRSTTIHRVVEEIYQTVEWAHHLSGPPEELVGLAQVIQVAKAHEAKMASIVLGGLEAGQ